MNQLLAEEKGLKVAHLPVDLNAAAITGARIGLAKGDKVAVVFQCDAGAGATVQLTLKQHNAATAGTSKVVAIDNPYYVKAGAATSFTKVEPTVAASLVDLSAQLGGASGIAVIEILGEQLDVDGGFAWFSVDIADAGAAKIASTVYVLGDMRYKPAYSEAL